MAILQIRTWGDPVLKTRAQEITEVNDNLRRLGRDMLDTMYAKGGIGLAANQIGAVERIFVVEIPSSAGVTATYTLVNPIITSRSRRREQEEEGCLSFPGLFGRVERSAEVEIQGLDLEGKKIILKGSGLLARAFQHELDHLDGIVFIERMPMVQRVMLNRQLRDLAKHTKAVLAGRGSSEL
ncbi:peptide deformylase [bacterium]|nr:peptide deformylase [bacterium]